MSSNTNTLFWVITGAVVVLGIFLLTNNTSDETINGIGNKFNGMFEDVSTDPKIKQYYGHVPNYQNLKITDPSLFEFNSSTQTITGYIGTDPNIVIPYEIDGVEVKKIANLNLYNKSLMSERCELFLERYTANPSDSLASSQINQMLRYGVIRNGTCQKSTMLDSVVFPNTIIEIGNQSFMSNRNLDGVIIPNSVERIGNQAFASTGLTSIDLSKLTNLREISSLAFGGAKLTGTVIIPECVTSLADNIFPQNDISHGIIKSNIEYMPYYIFTENPNLIDVTILSSNMKIHNLSSGRDYTFGQDSDFIIYVPIGSKSHYQSFEALANYKIIEKDMSNI